MLYKGHMFRIILDSFTVKDFKIFSAFFFLPLMRYLISKLVGNA